MITPARPQYAYGPDAVAALAKYWGAVKDLKDDDGGYDGEFGAIKNADNYVAFALSVYFQDKLGISDPIEPKGPWRTIPKTMVDPVPKRETQNGNFTGEFSQYLNFPSKGTEASYSLWILDRGQRRGRISGERFLKLNSYLFIDRCTVRRRQLA